MSGGQGDLAYLRFISAGAGSGKTYRLTEELEQALSGGTVTPAAVIGTTFTVKAATELHDRVRTRLVERGRPLLSEQMAQALIGTVHSVCGRLLTRFAFELGLSPEINVASVEDGARLFNQALDEVLSADRVREMNLRAERLGLVDARAGTSWQDHVRKIASQARSNDIDPSVLPTMGRESAERFLGYFPEVSCGDAARKVLLTAVKKAIVDIDLVADTTKTTRGYVGNLRSAVAELHRDSCRWTLWISLSKWAPAKRSADSASPVRAAAAVYDRHAGFHDDIRRYIEDVFAIAAETLSSFQRLKTERGLVDYDDMEQLTLRALDEPAVAQRLNEEVELLFVDEFQDTNPMQLALFMKIARFARDVVFVGDVKQAIYGFRGSDPELVRSALDALQARGSRRDVLDGSWRSRPSVVSYLNAVFREAFRRDGMERAMIELAPMRKEVHDAPAVVWWTLPKKLAEQADALAFAVAELQRTGHRVTDPETGEVRPVIFGDIVVLAATNSHVQAIGNAFRERRIPMKMSLAGLLETPEVCLAKACLRRLNDPADTISTAEIRSLGSCEEPEVWLADRLRWLADADDRDRSWAETDDPMVSRIAQLRPQTITQSPVEIVARVLNYVGVRAIATAWGPDAITAAQRQRNLDAFLDLSVEYENHCASQHEAATLTGLLLWLENPTSPELDLQPVVTGGDAVHVLTYHRAKGLEWPVVVATDFHYVWRPRIWDVRVESAANGLDLDDPLQGRAIRFYPNVFGTNTKGIPVLDRIMGSEEAAQAAAAADSEGRRLAYVGMTRARDTIIVALPPSGPRAGAWIKNFGSDHLLPSGDRHAPPKDEPIPSAAVDLTTADFEVPAPPQFTPSWFVERSPSAQRLRERLSPSEAPPAEGAATGDIVELGQRIALHGDDMQRIGTALHATIAAEFVNPGRDDAVDCAASLIRNSAGDRAIDPADAIRCARRLMATIDDRFSPLRVLVEYPVEFVKANGQVLRGWIDLLLETDEGWVVIDHKSSPRPRSEWGDEALAYSGQLAAYAAALRGAGLDCAGCWVHFPVSGGLVEVVWGDEAGQA
ncbi:UvrD-helicase domain-containing protein [Candidatus Rariloculus sp.]|uniref:UvrD-helicase domain-containing protein n=1 Tax=Candidatus Rariloculus sp. TaxID=3101265 RepID=UPI003D0E29B8